MGQTSKKFHRKLKTMAAPLGPAVRGRAGRPDMPSIEVVKIDALPTWKEMAQEGGLESARRLRSQSPPRITHDTLLAAMYPTTAKWVRRGGWIEIGDQGGCGFVVRALDEGGLVFESTEARTLDEGMTALERGIAEQIDDEGIV